MQTPCVQTLLAIKLILFSWTEKKEKKKEKTDQNNHASSFSLFLPGGSVYANHNLSEHKAALKRPTPHMSPVIQSRTGSSMLGLSDRQTRQLTLSIWSHSEQEGRESAFTSWMCGSSCHLTWITFTTSPESPPLAGWPGRMSWIPVSSAACWSVTEPSGRPAWLSATPPTDTRQSTNRRALTCSPVSNHGLLIYLSLILNMIFLFQFYSKMLRREWFC